jgi:hypothetical protein
VVVEKVGGGVMVEEEEEEETHLPLALILSLSFL